MIAEAINLLPCPFCGSKSDFGEITEGENFGGHFIECTNAQCGCSTCLMFPDKCNVKELLAEKWNARLLNEVYGLRVKFATTEKELKDVSELLAEARVHECQTLDEIGAIIGNDDSLEQCARRVVRERDEALKLLATRVEASRLDEAEKRCADWCSLFVKARNTLRAIYDETDPYSDGATDASAHDLLCNKISSLVIGVLGREGVDARNAHASP